MIHFTPVAKFDVADTTLVCTTEKFGDMMEMIFFISEFQCTTQRHLFIYRVSDRETSDATTNTDPNIVLDYRPTLTYAVYEFKEKL